MEEVRLGSRTLQPRRQLIANGQRLPLGKRALDIISVLAEARGQIVTKEELLEAVWPGVIVEENALQVHVTGLRKALGPEADRLKTIRSVGYQLDIDGAVASGSTPPAPRQPEDDELAEIPNDDRAAPQAPISDFSSSGEKAVSPPTKAGPAVWSMVRSSRFGLAAAAVVLALLVAWTFTEFRPGPHERIPVIVRPLTGSGIGDRTETALASGITDELIVRLRQVPELRIGTAGVDGTATGDAFRNAYVVDGTIRNSGDRLRVAARLFNHDGEILWSQTFDRGLVDLFGVQEAMAASIADALSVSFEVGANSAEYGGTNNPEAYAAYLQYRAHQMDRDQSVPVGHLQRALALDPHYVRALSALSVAYGLQAGFATGKQALVLLDKMDGMTARALAANPNLGIGHAARGWYLASRRNISGQERSFQRAAQLDTGTDPELRSQLVSYPMTVGRNGKTLRLLNAEVATDPINRYDRVRMGVLVFRGREKEAIDLFERLAADDPGSIQQYAYAVFWAHLRLEGEADAIRFADRNNSPLGEDLIAFKADKALFTMSSAELRQWAARRYGEGGHVGLSNSALFAAYYGHPKLAIELLQLAVGRPGAQGITVFWNPVMAEIRRTDAFEKLVTDIGLVKMWRESGDWGDFCRPVSAQEISCR